MKHVEGAESSSGLAELYALHAVIVWLMHYVSCPSDFEKFDLLLSQSD